jgi:hypothetical protein
MEQETVIVIHDREGAAFCEDDGAYSNVNDTSCTSGEYDDIDTIEVS